VDAKKKSLGQGTGGVTEEYTWPKKSFVIAQNEAVSGSSFQSVFAVDEENDATRDWPLAFA
jgi:hypothetical protein